MFRPAAVFIGLRYTRAKRRNHFISFISLMSMLGIALGMIVLITVLSVMNGFDREIKQRIFGLWPPLTITSQEGPLHNWQGLATTLHDIPFITSVAPFVTGQVLITNNNNVQPVMMTGIDPAAEKKLSELNEKMVQGQLSDLIGGTFGIVLGEELANRLGVMLGDKVTVITSHMSVTPAGVLPRFKRFTVIGLFRAGAGFGFDMALAYVQLADAQKLFQLGNGVSGLHATIQDVFKAPTFSLQLAKQLPTVHIATWADQFGTFFHAIQLEKSMMFFILMLIIAVAVFNLVCTLVMVVNDKEADIAILRTQGATPKMIMAIFVVQGAVVGIVGTLLGMLGGILLALHVTEIVNWIQMIFHVQFLSSSVYFVNYLPSELQWLDVVKVSSMAFGLSLLATIYPAWRAAKTEPVEALRYE